MKFRLHLALLLLCLPCVAADRSEDDLQRAQKSFEHALEMQKHGQIEEALTEATRAATLAPDNVEYLTARELLRGQAAGLYVNRGNLLAEGGDNKHAAEQFQAALAIDPQNGYAQERLRAVLPSPDPERDHLLQVLASVDDVDVKPKPGKQDFHIKGDTHSLYDTIGRTFGITISYDQAVTSWRVRFDVEAVDFYQAMDLAGRVTKTFWAPVSTNMAIVAEDNQEMRRQYERMSLRTFYVSNTANATDLNDVVNVLRTVFDLRLVSLQPSKNTITVRGPKRQLEHAAELIDGLMDARPEVLVEIRAYEVNYDKLRQYGLVLPNTFTIFNVFSEIRRVLGDAAGPIIQQLQNTGVIDPSKIPVTALSGLQGSPLLLPFVFFGKGLGLTGVTVSPISGSARFSNSEVKTLEHVSVRATSGTAAKLQIGTRFPIETSTFSNVTIANSGNAVTSSSIPSFQYEDLGVIFKATPRINTGDEVSMEMDLEIKNLGGQSFNGVPVISNRSYTGTIIVKDGEPSVVAGQITDQINNTKSGYPGLGQVPILGGVFDTNSKEHSRNEILVVVTPHIIRKSFKHLTSPEYEMAR